MGVRVRQKPKGSGEYWIFINHKGKRKSKRIGKDRKKANEIAKKLGAQLVLNEFGMDEKAQAPKFKEYSVRWLEGFVKQVKRRNTYDRYQGLLKHYIIPAIGNRPIDQIKRSDIREILLGLHSRGLSLSTIGLVKGVISATLNFAMDEELIETNPATDALKRLGLKRERNKPVQPMTVDEVNLFLDTCKHHLPEHYPLFLLLFRTGLRLGECCGLKWIDFDWNQKLINVKRSYGRNRFEKPKSGKSRMVDMSDQLADCMRGLLTKRKRQALEAGLGEPVEIVFYRNGKPMHQNYVRYLFKRMLKKAGMRDMHVHITRHTFASLLLSAGESVVYVKDQLGHSSIQITVDVYSHLMPGSNRGAVNRLDNMHHSAPPAHPTKTGTRQQLAIVANR